MRKTSVLKVLAFLVVGTALIHAQASRTWVSGVGDDVNPCSRTAPCKTWAGAISKTAVGGEIDALDPGGFGALTITKSITLDGGGGQVASVLVQGTNGIVVAGTNGNENVIIRNLRLNGLAGSGNGGLDGIKFLTGHSLTIQNCFIFGFQNGINIASSTAGAQVVIEGTSSTNNSQIGLNVSAGANVVLSVDSSHFDNNTQHGVLISNFGTATISNTTANSNAIVGFLVSGTAGAPTMHLANCVAANNAAGVQAGGGTVASLATASGCALSGNVIGFTQSSAGTIKSFGNNANTDGGVTTTPNLNFQ